MPNLVRVPLSSLEKQDSQWDSPLRDEGPSDHIPQRNTSHRCRWLAEKAKTDIQNEHVLDILPRKGVIDRRGFDSNSPKQD